MSRFRLSAGGSRAHEPWFRIGTLDVGTTWVVVFLGVAGILAYAFGGDSLEMKLAFAPIGEQIARHPWTFVTWPFAIIGSNVMWTVLGLVFFWLFGRDLEASILGRVKLAWWLVGAAVTFALLDWLLVTLIPSWLAGSGLFGLSLLGLSVLLLWCAEWPHRLFFLGISAWVVGIVFFVIQILQYVHDESWALLWAMVLGLGVSAFTARQFGALGEYHQIPRLAGGPRRPRTRKKKPGPTVIAGPWDGTRTPPQAAPPLNRDAARMDELLDKISAHGTDSLTTAERRELEELRLRRKR